jgi:hypothetical protein
VRRWTRVRFLALAATLLLSTSAMQERVSPLTVPLPVPKPAVHGDLTRATR